jgi:hypothetical protein
MAARTAIAVTTVSRTALTAFATPTTAADVTNGNVIANDGATILAVVSGDAATHQLTVQVERGVDGLTAGPRTYTVPVAASGVQLTGPYPVRDYGTQLMVNGDSAQIKIAPYSLLGP